jgi:hypothetical protein
MHVRMTDKEVKEAIRDWLDKHGISVTEKNEIENSRQDAVLRHISPR